jgi:hypothetical protein
MAHRSRTSSRWERLTWLGFAPPTGRSTCRRSSMRRTSPPPSSVARAWHSFSDQVGRRWSLGSEPRRATSFHDWPHDRQSRRGRCRGRPDAGGGGHCHEGTRRCGILRGPVRVRVSDPEGNYWEVAWAPDDNPICGSEASSSRHCLDQRISQRARSTSAITRAKALIYLGRRGSSRRSICADEFEAVEAWRRGVDRGSANHGLRRAGGCADVRDPTPLLNLSASTVAVPPRQRERSTLFKGSLDKAEPTLLNQAMS